MAKGKKEAAEGNVLVKLNKSYQFGTGKNAVKVAAFEEVELTAEQLAVVDKKDIVKDEEKN